MGRPLLAQLDALPVDARVVHDHNRITSGVTAGMDFGLTLAALLCSALFAKTLQLLVEYDPQPPFQGGHPLDAEPEVLQLARAPYSEDVANADTAIANSTRRRSLRPAG